jgi:hypothetical protein
MAEAHLILHQILDHVRRIEELVTPKKKAKATPKAPLTDREWLDQLCTAPAYRGVNVKKEYEKMCIWCSANNCQPTRKRFVNWLNRVDRSMTVPVQPQLPPVMVKEPVKRPAGEDAPPEVKERLSKLLGRDFMRMP